MLPPTVVEGADMDAPDASTGKTLSRFQLSKTTKTQGRYKDAIRP